MYLWLSWSYQRSQLMMNFELLILLPPSAKFKHMHHQWLFFFLLFVETTSYSIEQPGLELSVIPLELFKCWNYRHEPLYPALDSSIYLYYSAESD